MGTLNNFKFWTIQTDTVNGLDFYKDYYNKSYAEKIFKQQCEHLEETDTAGAVTLYENHNFVKEFVHEGGQRP